MFSIFSEFIFLVSTFLFANTNIRDYNNIYKKAVVMSIKYQQLTKAVLCKMFL